MELKALLKTVDIQNIEQYINNVSSIHIDNTNEYIAQINTVIKDTKENICISFPNSSDSDKIWEYISHITQTYRQIYFEVGLYAGIKLVMRFITIQIIRRRCHAEQSVFDARLRRANKK